MPWVKRRNYNNGFRPRYGGGSAFKAGFAAGARKVEARQRRRW